jgi:hypothetical protein
MSNYDTEPELSNILFADIMDTIDIEDIRTSTATAHADLRRWLASFFCFILQREHELEAVSRKKTMISSATPMPNHPSVSLESTCLHSYAKSLGHRLNSGFNGRKSCHRIYTSPSFAVSIHQNHIK